MESSSIQAFLIKVLIGLSAALLSIIAYFLKNILTKFENILIKIEILSSVSTINNVKLEIFQKQMEDIGKIRADVAALNYAILGYIRNTKK